MIGVVDANIANQERIVFRPTQPVDMARFALFLGWQTPGGGCTPLRDHFFWLGEVTVAEPSWIIVFTGPGEYRVRDDLQFGTVYEYHWGRDKTLFVSPNIVPLLARMDVLTIGSQTLPPGSR